MKTNFCSLLSLLFAWAKLTALIDWSWWAVLSPISTYVILATFVELSKEQSKVK